MAKRVKQYKGFIIKQTTERDNCGFTDDGGYVYWIFNRDGEREWEADSLDECIEWIDSY